MESDGGGEKGERYERKGRKISGITVGHFWNISKKLKCFLKFTKHLIFIPKTLKSVFKGRNTFENHCQMGS